MDNFKKASQLQLRFATTKGLLSVEQLWGLSTATLASTAKAIKQDLKKASADDDLSFLTEATVTKVDVENQLRFEIVKDVYLTKKAEQDAARTKEETKAHNQRIMELIQNKKERELEGKSIEELQAMLKD
jgi:hypothetical protein